MPSYTLLPITNRPPLCPSSSSLSIASSASPSTMLLKGKNDVDVDDDDDDDPSTSLLHSSFHDNNIININGNKIIPIKRTSSFTSTTTNNHSSSIGGVPCFYQKRRRRAASEDSLSSIIPNGTATDRTQSSSFGHDVRHVASETFLLTRLGLKMLTYLGYITMNCSLQLILNC